MDLIRTTNRWASSRHSRVQYRSSRYDDCEGAVRGSNMPVLPDRQNDRFEAQSLAGVPATRFWLPQLCDCLRQHSMVVQLAYSVLSDFLVVQQFSNLLAQGT